MKKKSNSPNARTGGKAGTEKARDAGSATSSSASQGWVEAWFSPSAIREIVESIVIAFVLAFLFRSFEAEAFVIPTGSMAPTLMGRHKDLVCPKCGYPFRVSASDEVNPQTNELTNKFVMAATCPNCRYTIDLATDERRGISHESYKGDRILVAKFPYQLGDPDRWDVAVFMYPGGAKTNYIKRLVGLPNETLVINHGDIFTRKEGEEEFHIARKPPSKILAMMQPVYDNDYVVPSLVNAGWPERWSSLNGGWKSEDLKTFRSSGEAGESWLAYRHFAPGYNDWVAHLRGEQLTSRVPQRPSLITDFNAYNTDQIALSVYPNFAGDLPIGPQPQAKTLGVHWVGDLILEFDLQSQSNDGRALVKLIEAGHEFRAEFDLAAGDVTLKGLPGGEPKAKTSVRGPGKHHIRFANVDDQLTLWVDGAVVKFDQPTTYNSAELGMKRPYDADLEPAQIGTRDADVRVSHLKLFRDLYYISDSRGGDPLTDWENGQVPPPEFFHDPQRWSEFWRLERSVPFELGKDQYFMLGDNSAESKDGRLWGNDSPWAPTQYYVDRDLLKGKAVFVYWPHSWNRTPGFPLAPEGIRFPMFPNVARMKFVR